MNYAKRITVSACALFIMLGFIAGGVSKLWDFESAAEQKKAENTAAIAELPTPEVIPDTKYVLKIEDGIVVVFNEADMTRPIIVTDIYASTLRHFDREQLTCGVIATGDFELQSMLEDYSS